MKTTFVEIDINSRPIPYPAVRRKAISAAETGLPGTQFEIPVKAWTHFRGDNTLGIIVHNWTQRAAIPYMEELEVLVR